VLKKSSHSLFFFFIVFDFLFKAFFGRFVTRGVQKHEKNNPKNPSGLITKNAAFFLPFFFSPSLGRFRSIFFYRVFGRFAARGVQKRDKTNRAKITSAFKKGTHLLTSLFFCFFRGPPCLALAPVIPLRRRPPLGSRLNRKSASKGLYSTPSPFPVRWRLV
jgi:hypothetical protein